MIILDEKIRRLVAYYVRKYNTNDPFKIAEHLGIQVYFVPLGNVSGNYRYFERTKCIFINSDIDDSNYLMTIMAHELGHALLHWKENCCFMAHRTLLLTSKIERQANLFAAYLLITDNNLKDFIGFTVEQFSECTGFDIDLINLRIRNNV